MREKYTTVIINSYIKFCYRSKRYFLSGLKISASLTIFFATK